MLTTHVCWKPSPRFVCGCMCVCVFLVCGCGCCVVRGMRAHAWSGGAVCHPMRLVYVSQLHVFAVHPCWVLLAGVPHICFLLGRTGCACWEGAGGMGGEGRGREGSFCVLLSWVSPPCLSVPLFLSGFFFLLLLPLLSGPGFVVCVCVWRSTSNGKHQTLALWPQ